MLYESVACQQKLSASNCCIEHRDQVGGCLCARDRPWVATQQGGLSEVLDDRPHLRLINFDQNRASGAELAEFYDSNNVSISCGVEDGEFFMTLPLTPMFLPNSVNGEPVDNFSRVESASICFNGN